MRRLKVGPDVSVPALALVACLFAAQAAAQEVNLKQQIILLGASQDNAQLEQAVLPGAVVLPLTFRVNLPPGATSLRADLTAMTFAAEGPQPHSLRPMLRGFGAAPPAKEGDRLALTLTSGWLDVELRLSGVHPKTTYKGKLYLFSDGKSHAWEMTLKAGDLGILAVDKLPPLKLVTYDPFARTGSSRRFPITLRDKSRQGPYTQLRVRVEDPNQAKTTAISSNFTVDALSFWGDCPGQGPCAPLNLLTRDGLRPQGGSSGGGARTVDVGPQLTIWAQVESLSPGEYSPVLRFLADGASEQAEESKLALTLQVRHHWWLAVVVILLGSAAGWFGNKYVGAYWTTRALRREGNELFQAAALLARPDPRGGGWRFPGESNSYALARVRVILRQVEHLTKNAFLVMAVEPEIRDRLAEARRRLAALEAFRGTRLKVQRMANERPAAQHAIGGALRGALDILDRPAFAEPQRAAVDEILKGLEAWLSPDQGEALYREAVLGRVRQLLATVTAMDLPAGQVRDRITALLEKIRKGAEGAQLPADALPEYDRLSGRLTLLWRDRLKSWAETLAQEEAAGRPLEALYLRTDREVWARIRDAAGQGQIDIVGATRAGSVEAYDLVEVRLALHGEALAESHLIRHPCVVRWQVSPLDGGPPRETVTDGLTLVQYFPTTGTVAVGAQLEWEGERIDVPEGQIKVAENREYRRMAAFGPLEAAVTGLAALFATLTGLGTQYDATFGSSGQYIGLLIWAAGASTGGNLFRQRGSGRTVGGQEAQLPGR
ncbi:MAG: hypothetical protein HYY85_17275 [Deltaproteobacteria bacterium]|nr:hypothetical protein [Deltaproteobacteria bacterium]